MTTTGPAPSNCKMRIVCLQTIIPCTAALGRSGAFLSFAGIEKAPQSGALGLLGQAIEAVHGEEDEARRRRRAEVGLGIGEDDLDELFGG